MARLDQSSLPSIPSQVMPIKTDGTVVLSGVVTQVARLVSPMVLIGDLLRHEQFGENPSS